MKTDLRNQRLFIFLKKSENPKDTLRRLAKGSQAISSGTNFLYQSAVWLVWSPFINGPSQKKALCPSFRDEVWGQMRTCNLLKIPFLESSRVCWRTQVVWLWSLPGTSLLCRLWKVLDQEVKQIHHSQMFDPHLSAGYELVEWCRKILSCRSIAMVTSFTFGPACSGHEQLLFLSAPQTSLQLSLNCSLLSRSPTQCPGFENPQVTHEHPGSPHPSHRKLESGAMRCSRDHAG